MKFKQLFSAILSTIMVFSSLFNSNSFSIKVKATDKIIIKDKVDVYKSGSCGENLTYTLTTDMKLTISGSGEMFDFYYINKKSPWYEDSEYIKELIIQEGITYIGVRAFFGFKQLKEVSIPDSVTNIGGSAFSGCTGLTSITIPDSVTNIGGSAFSGCTGLTSITIPNTVTNIGENAFYQTPWLINKQSENALVSVNSILIDGTKMQGEVTIPNTIKEIGEGAFQKCSSITSITIPNTVTNIGGSAFSGCTGLTSITIPDSVTNIGGSAFNECTGITSITIPNSVTSIGNASFKGCKNLSSIIIPEGITDIGDEAFKECTNLTSITIPNSVISIGNASFKGCKNLSSIIIPESVINIGAEAFGGTDWFLQKQKEEDFFILNGILLYGKTGYNKSKNIVIPNNVNIIGGYSFSSRDQDLTSVIIPEGVKQIEEGAFSYSYLRDVYIPKSVEYIGKGAFGFCPKLDVIIIDNPDCEIYDDLLTICNNNYDDFGSCFFKGTIKGHNNSTAEAFAKKYQLKFISLEDEPIITTTTTTTNTPTTTTTTSNKEEFKLSVTSVSLNNGNQYVIPLNYSDVTYKSTNTDVAIVSPKGIVTAVGEGEAIINIIDKDYNVIQLKIAVKSANINPDDYKFGDVNGDNQINAVDASAVLAYYAMISTNKDGNFNESQKAAADVNGDGQINAVDASNILAYYAYLSTTKEDILSLKEYMKK